MSLTDWVFLCFLGMESQTLMRNGIKSLPMDIVNSTAMNQCTSTPNEIIKRWNFHLSAWYSHGLYFVSGSIHGVR